MTTIADIAPEVSLISESWRVAQPAISGGQAFSEPAQVVLNLTPPWQFRARLRVPRRRVWQVEGWIDARRSNAIAAPVTPSFESIMLHRPAMTFDYGIEFQGEVGFGPVRHDWPALVAPAAQFAQTITVGDATLCAVGEFFFLSGYMYRCAAKAGNVIQVAPPLRTAVAAGVRLGNQGAVNMVMTSVGDLDLTPGGSSDVDLTMIEKL